MNLRGFLRAKRWAAQPPSAKRVKLVLGIVALCLILFGIEHFFGWPDALTLQHANGRILR